MPGHVVSRKFHSRPVAPGASGSIAGRSSAARLLPTPTGREIQDSSGTEPWLQGREPAGQHSLLQVGAISPSLYNMAFAVICSEPFEIAFTSAPDYSFLTKRSAIFLADLGVKEQQSVLKTEYIIK